MPRGLGLSRIQAVAMGRQQQRIERPADAGNVPEQAKARALRHAQQGKRPDVIARQRFKRPDMAGEGRGHDREVSHWQKIGRKKTHHSGAMPTVGRYRNLRFGLAI